MAVRNWENQEENSLCIFRVRQGRMNATKLSRQSVSEHIWNIWHGLARLWWRRHVRRESWTKCIASIYVDTGNSPCCVCLQFHVLASAADCSISCKAGYQKTPFRSGWCDDVKPDPETVPTPKAVVSSRVHSIGIGARGSGGASGSQDEPQPPKYPLLP